jgi:hypothetical protein
LSAPLKVAQSCLAVTPSARSHVAQTNRRFVGFWVITRSSWL